MKHTEGHTSYFSHENIMNLLTLEDTKVLKRIKEEFYPALCSFVNYVTNERYLSGPIALETIENFSQRLVYTNVENYVFELYNIAERLILETIYGLDAHHKAKELDEIIARGFIQAELLRTIYPIRDQLPMLNRK